jgi:Protein of unknown function (DUF2510)
MSHSAPQPVTAPPPGWYPDPGGSGAHRWWTGAGWSDAVQAGPGQAASAGQPAPQQLAPQQSAPQQPQSFPATASTSIVPSAGSVSSPKLSLSGLSPRIVVGVIVGIIVIVSAVMRFHPSVDVQVATGAQAKTQQADFALKGDMQLTEFGLRNYHTKHGTYQVPGMKVGVQPDADNELMVKATKSGFCLRGSNPASSANGQTYDWYDSQAGGAQSGVSPMSPSATKPGAACAGGGLFLPVQ